MGIVFADVDAVDQQPLASPWFAWTSTPTVHPFWLLAFPGPSTMRDAVPVPPLKSWQIIPVPPPTSPSGTGPSDAASMAAKRCSARTWKPSMSFSAPS